MTAYPDWFQPSGWSEAHGLKDVEFALAQNQILGTPIPPAISQWINSQAGGSDVFDQWNNLVRTYQDRESPKGLFGIDGLSTGIPALDNVAGNLLLTGNQLGGQTGYNAATNQDIGQGVATDLAGLGAGAGLASVLPATGLSTVAAAPGGAAAGGSGLGAEAANVAGGLHVAPEAASLGSAISGASTAGGASGIVPGLATETAGGLGGGLSVPGVTGGGSLGALSAGALGAGIGGGLVAGSAAPAAAAGTAAAGGTGAVGAGTAAAAGGIGATKLSDLASGNVGVGDLAAGATVGDLARILGTGALTLGGMYGASQQASAYKDLANQYMNLGAPSRARYEASYQPGFTMASDPGYSDALAQTTKETLHQLSPGGNPMGSPNAWEQTLKDVNDKFAFPALQQYRNQNAAGGGLSALTSAAPGAASAGINADANVYNALGAGTADIFNPPKSLSDILRQMKQAGY